MKRVVEGRIGEIWKEIERRVCVDKIKDVFSLWEMEVKKFINKNLYF